MTSTSPIYYCVNDEDYNSMRRSRMLDNSNVMNMQATLQSMNSSVTRLLRFPIAGEISPSRVLHEFFFVVVRLRSLDDVPFLSDRKLRHFLIGSNNKGSLAVKVFKHTESDGEPICKDRVNDEKLIEMQTKTPPTIPRANPQNDLTRIPLVESKVKEIVREEFDDENSFYQEPPPKTPIRDGIRVSDGGSRNPKQETEQEQMTTTTSFALRGSFKVLEDGLAPLLVKPEKKNGI
ncbi:hypothetical protein M5K25_020595 [Dendrobium thyrsiflorum]|uniref:Uncharacterized protein n=1 Tax=Dendrobium thyrsiflorum TaxID=117978 RepID=A0ABD0UA92_DENTH